MELRSSTFLIDSQDFERAQSCIRTIFMPTARLPNAVFQERYGNYCFIEFDSMIGSQFGKLLSACARTFGDDEVYMSLRDPDPESYYYTYFKRYGVLRLQVELLETSYADSIFDPPGASTADAMAYISSCACWWGSSRLWGFWGERDLGVGVGGRLKTATNNWPRWSTIPSFEAEEILSSVVSLNYRDDGAFQEFARVFLNNYGSK